MTFKSNFYFLRDDSSQNPAVPDIESGRIRKIYDIPNFTKLKLEILVKTLQTDKKKRNVLTCTRDAVDKLVVYPHEESVIKKCSNMLDENNPFYMEAGYLLHNVANEILNQLDNIKVSKLEGTVGIWDVSEVF